MIVSRLHPTAPDTTHPLAERRLLRFAAGGPENAHPELEAMKTEVLNKVQLANAPEARKAMNERMKAAGQDVDAAKVQMLEGIATIAKAEFDALTAKGDTDAEQKVKDRFAHAGMDVTKNPDGSFTASKLTIEQADVQAPVTLDAAMEKDLNGLSPAMKAVAQEMLQDAGDAAAGKKIVDTFTALGKNPKAFALLMNLDLAKADLLTSLPAEQKKTIDPILAVDSDLSVMQSVREKFGRVMAQEKPATGAFSNDQMQEMLKPVQDELNKNASKIPTMTDAQLQRFKGQLMLKYGVAIEESGEGAGRTLTASAPSSQWEVFMNKFLGIMAIIGSLQAELQNKGKKETKPTTPEQQPEKPSTESKGRKLFENIGIPPNDKGEYVFKADLGYGITDVTYKFLGGEWKWQNNTEPLPQTLTTDSHYDYQSKDAANLTKKQRMDRGVATNIARALGGLKNAKPEDPVPTVETSVTIEDTGEGSDKSAAELSKIHEDEGNAYLSKVSSMTRMGKNVYQYDADGGTEYNFRFNGKSGQWEWGYEDDAAFHATTTIPADKWQNDPTLAENEVPIPESYRDGIDLWTQDLNDKGMNQARDIIKELQRLNTLTDKDSSRKSAE